MIPLVIDMLFGMIQRSSLHTRRLRTFDRGRVLWGVAASSPRSEDR